MSGTTPEGAHSEADAARWVREMFGRVAPRYDLANHLLSFQVDRWWRRRIVQTVKPVLMGPHVRALDLCCGTGDLLRALQRARGAAVMGSDFSHPMLMRARTKAGSAAPLVEADGLSMPFEDASLDLITIAFGFRNFVHYERALHELRRLLRRGGMLAILEFSTPQTPGFRAMYELYSRRLLPLIGGALTGSLDAYTYLPESIRKFPDAPRLAEMMRDAGFAQVTFERLTFGIAAIHQGRVH